MPFRRRRLGPQVPHRRGGVAPRWDRAIPFFAFPPAVRPVISTTNATESINTRLRKIVKSRGHFLSDDAATRPICLALRNLTADWAARRTTGRRR